MRDRQGQLIGFTKITRDLSGRKQAEDALRESEERNRLIVESARDYAIFMTDTQGRILTWNSGAERIFGYSLEEAIGQDDAILFTPQDQASQVHERELATAVAQGRADDERWQMRKGGERFWASGVTHPLRAEDGTLRGFVKICRDLTGQREVQNQREQMLEQEKIARLEAERAMTLRDEFLAVVSHELRTPLTAILLWAKMVNGGRLSAEEVPRALDNILKSAEAQRQLIEDLLDVSRMIAGKLRLNVRETELVPVIQAAADAIRPMADAKGITVALSLDERAGHVRIDPDRIQQVVWNLLNNAVKFTQPGGQVWVDMRRTNGEVRLRVSDNGQGINPRFLPHVFERFRQADASTTRQAGGLGIGLSICRQLVELHGGTISAQSPGLGKGATFEVALPIVEIRRPLRRGASVPSHDGQAVEPPAPLDGIRVLVVDDEENHRVAVERLLQDAGAVVTVVASAALAVAAYRAALANEPFDVLISDVGLPVQDGYDLIRDIRNLERQRGRTRNVPAIALTAYTRDEDRARATAAGFQAHLPKPFEPDRLVQLVQQLLGRAAK